ncbi:MAG TPA: hypothetical protein VF911_13890 [Thermoanaerobaculia bacterium]
MTEEKLDRIAMWSAFAAVLFSAAYFFGGSGFNQNATFDMTRSLVEHRELHIDRYAGNTADISRANGHIYSNKVPGLSFVAAIPYAVIHLLRGAPQHALEATFALYLCTVAICGLSAALIALLLFKAARHRAVTRERALAIAIVSVLGTPMFAYATMLFPHVPSCLLALLAFLSLDGTLRRRPLVAGAAVGAAVLMHYLCALLVIVTFAFALATSRRRVRDAVQYALGGLPFAILLGAYHVAVFGSPFRTTVVSQNPGFITEGAWFGIFSLPKIDALWGLTFSPFRGLFYIAPLLLVAALGLVAMARRERAAAATIAATTIFFLLVNSAFNVWHGSYTIGPRYSLPVIPLLALGLIYVSERWTLLTTTIAAISLLFNFAVTAVDAQPPDTLRDPIGKYAIPALITGSASDDPSVPPWIPALYTGHTSTNRVAIDELVAYQRRRPESVENAWSSFNLGEPMFGAGAFASLLPYFAGMALLLFTVRASLRRPHRATHTTRGTQTERSRSA